ncbi:hypothetical protein [Streptomyces sp. NPDC094472]|uniref:hypothetical protein n=1 Tax=Streptomyces sp. NPDC094472 TaxID=3155080 RepID=UPI00332B8C1E
MSRSVAGVGCGDALGPGLSQNHSDRDDDRDDSRTARDHPPAFAAPFPHSSLLIIFDVYVIKHLSTVPNGFGHPVASGSPTSAP